MKHTDLSSQKNIAFRRIREGGNAIAMVFMAIGMAGVITYGLNNIMRGPAVTAAETSRRTIAENNLVASTRLAIAAAANQPGKNGDCDSDGFVEPLPFRTPPVGVNAPTGGGLLPMTLGASLSDPWGNQYGYCVWDPGTVSKSDANAACGGGTANRLEGAPRDDRPAIAVISAGKDGTFQTSCNDYIDTTPADGKPDTEMVVKAAGSDDIVLTYTYAEANGIGGGLWKIRDGQPDIAEIGMNIESTSTGGASFGGKVELKNKGLVLPGDPGDDTVTGACDLAKDGQIRRNTSTSPPTLEMCDFTNSNGWTQISGSSAPDVFDPKQANCKVGESGPFTVVGSTDLIVYPSGLWTKVGRNGPQTLFVMGDISGGTNVLSFNGSDFSILKHDNRPNRIVTGEGDYLFTTMPAWEYIDVWKWDGTDLTLIDTVNTTGSQYPGGVWAKSDGSVYVAEYGNGVGIYNFDGTNLNLVTKGGAGTALGVQERDGYLYTSGWPRRTHHWDGTTLTTPINAVNGNVIRDSNYVYVFDSSEIYAYTFDGVTETLAATSTGGLGGTIWTDGAHLFSVNGTPSKLSAISFDGTAFTKVAEIELPDQPASVQGGSIYGDGNYIYVALTGSSNDGRIYALAGFGCNSPAVPGGYVAPKPTAVSGARKYLPDPIDEGLIAHWKMDEGPDSKDIIDSVGTNNGSLVNKAARSAGQHGSGAVSFSYNNGDAIHIPGLLGEPQNLTFAGWVNIGDVDPFSGSATVWSMGDMAMLTYSPSGEFTTGYHDGSSYQFVTNPKKIMGEGWHYVVTTIDTDNDKMRLYVDGEATEASPTTAMAWTAGGPDTYFGKHGNGNGNYDLTGAVDDFRAYGRALSPAEVAALTKRERLESVEAESVKNALDIPFNGSKISVSQDYSCAIKQDGSLWCWGSNWPYSALGIGGDSRTPRTSPVRVKEPKAQIFYLTGTNSDLAVSGTNVDYVKNLSTFLETSRPSQSAFSAGEVRKGYGITRANYPGLNGSLGIKPYEVVINMDDPQPCLDYKVTLQRVNAAGVMQTSKELGKGTLSEAVTSVKNNVDLGTFTETNRILVEIELTETCSGSVSGFSIWSELRMPRIEHGKWLSVSAAETHACGLKSDGSAWCWGTDSSYSMGNSGFASGRYTEPSRVVQVNEAWSQISASPDHSCAVQTDGTLWCFGGDTQGQLGNGTNTGLKADPVQVGTESSWTSVTTGGLFTCGLKRNGEAWCWGDDAYGQLGNGPGVTADQVSPYLVADPGPWIKLSAGEEHICGIKADSSLWCWGHSTARELGVDNSSNQSLPVKISKPDGWVDVSAGSFFTCAINKDSKTYCWGSYANGRLGNPEVTANNFYPTQVVGSDGSVAISAGGDHACLMKNNGSVWCWGNDAYGQLGNGTGLTAAQSSPSPVPGFPGLVSWGWDTAASIIMAPYNMNIGIGDGILGSSSTRGFGFTEPGKAYLVQDVDSNQLILATTDTSSSTQITFNAAPEPNLTDITTSLVARWLLNDTSGTTATATPSGVNGTLTNGPIWDSRGMNGGALSFDGVDDYVVVSNSSTIRPTAISIALWVKPAAQQAGTAKILSKTYNNYTAPTYNTYGLTLSATGGTLTFEYGTTDNLLNTMTATKTLKADTWNYVVVSYDSGSKTPRARIYINGIDASSTETTSNKALRYTTSTPSGNLYFGQDATGAQRFKGEMDDIRIYSRKLTDEEVAQLYGYQTSLGSVPRSMGIDYTSNTLKVARNAGGTTMMNAISAADTHLALTSAGSLGVGTNTPGSILDVNGSVRFGSETICDANRVGAMRYTGGIPPWTYCDGTDWTSFPAIQEIGWKKDEKSLSIGDGYVCAIANNGKLYCWGVNTNGRLGNGTTSDTKIITEVHSNTGLPGWSDWKMVRGSINTTCGIRTNGTLWCWGKNYEGQAGNGDTSGDDYLRPEQVKDSAGTGYWSDWIDVATGENNSCGIRSNGRLYCWGDGWYYTNGEGTQSRYYLPNEVGTDTANAPGWTDWRSVSLFLNTTCGLRNNGTIWCWGANDSRQVGRNNATNAPRPVRVHDTSTTPTWTDWIQVWAGGHQTCGRRATGQAYCWGRGGNIGNNSNFGTVNGRPQPIHNEGAAPTWTDWKHIIAGFENACAIRTTGMLYCWGDDTYAQVGWDYNGSPKRPVHVHDNASSTGWYDWVSVQNGVFTTCGVRTDSSLWCWGYMDMGDGNGGNEWTYTRPNKVKSP